MGEWEGEMEGERGRVGSGGCVGGDEWMSRRVGINMG